VGFSENQRHLELVWDPGDRVMSSIYWKMGEKVVILEERATRFLYYYAVSIFLSSVGFSENQRHLELVWGPEERVIGSIY